MNFNKYVTIILNICLEQEIDPRNILLIDAFDCYNKGLTPEEFIRTI